MIYSRFFFPICVGNLALGIVCATVLLSVGGLGMASASSYAADEAVPLIPLEVLLGNPDRFGPQLSPDGAYFTYVAPVEGVLNVWINTVGQDEPKPLTMDKGRGVSQYFWSFNCEQVIYLQDKDGDENWRIYAIDIKTGETKQLADVKTDDGHPIQARVMELHPSFPDEMYVGLNVRDARIHDVYKVNMRTGDLVLVQESQLGTAGWLFDNNFVIRGYVQLTPDGGAQNYLREGADGPFELEMEVSADDIMTTSIIGFSPDNKTLYGISSIGRNSAALLEYDPATNESKLLAEDPIFDVSGVSVHPTEHYIEAVAFTRDREEWQVLDERVKPDFEKLINPEKGDLGILDRTLADDKWLVYYYDDNGPVSFYEYDRKSGNLNFLFVHRDALKDLPLVEMKPIQFESRDGLTVHGFLSLPLDWVAPGPMVLNVHGGPWYRDSWGFNPEAQWLANRGYACLQVNFRGSTGYGKEFINAASREWGGTMQNDLTDAVKWAISEGIADPSKIVIYGGSYGGYATLAGVTFTPELYAAGISMVGPSNLETFLNTIPPYWETQRAIWDQRVGRIPRYTEGENAGLPKASEDWTEEDKADIEFLHSRSPLFFVDNVSVPMFIAQGANDPRVNKAESDQFVEAMKAKGLEVEYVVYPDEGHGFARPENRLDFYYRADKFLAKILCGRCEEH